MKSKIVIEIETKEDNSILPEEGTTEEDYTKEQLIESRKEYAEDLMNYFVKKIESYITEDIEEYFLDNGEELYIEGWDEFSDYPVKINYNVEDVK